MNQDRNTEYVARNTSMRHVARLYLNWYAQESNVDVSPLAFVSTLARDRLSYSEANMVIEYAITYINAGYLE